MESTSYKLLNEKKNGVDISILFQVMNFWILNFYAVFLKLKMFLENHKHEQIIMGGCSFLQKNVFSKSLEKNWNKKVLQQFKV